MKTVSRAEFVALLNARGGTRLQQALPRFDMQMILGNGECAVHDGNLDLTADWRRPADNLLVLGAVDSARLVHAAREGSDSWGGSLWTLGDLRCRNFAGHYGTAVFIDGDLTVAELIVVSFEDCMLTVTNDLTAYFFYGQDIWAEVGGRTAIEYGVGYTLPLGYTNPAAQAIRPRQEGAASLALLNLGDEESEQELLAKIRRGEHLRATP